jgi:putative endonuclease
LAAVSKDQRVAFGKLGEDLACEELRRRGYVIVDRRFRTRGGELDIVARDGNVLVFVEVKARSGGTFGHGFEAITWQKRHRLSRMAASYLFVNHLSGAACRFDVVAVTGRAPGPLRVELLQNAFALEP